LTKQLNRVWGRRGGGTVFRERFKQVTLRGYKQITAALNYVLNNALKHWSKPVDGRPDRYSSAGVVSADGGAVPAAAQALARRADAVHGQPPDAERERPAR
jgi:hypothetical protein